MDVSRFTHPELARHAGGELASWQPYRETLYPRRPIDVRACRNLSDVSRYDDDLTVDYYAMEVLDNGDPVFINPGDHTKASGHAVHGWRWGLTLIPFASSDNGLMSGSGLWIQLELCDKDGDGLGPYVYWEGDFTYSGPPGSPTGATLSGWRVETDHPKPAAASWNGVIVSWGPPAALTLTGTLLEIYAVSGKIPWVVAED